MSELLDHSRRWQVRLALLLRVGLGSLFLIAGVLKVRDPVKFALEISNYQMLSSGTGLIAAVLPAMEIFAAIALVFLPRVWRQASALLMIVMVIVFTAAVGWAYFRGINIDCGCFGGAEGPITGWTLMRNLGLLLTSSCIFWLETKLLRSHPKPLG